MTTTDLMDARVLLEEEFEAEALGVFEDELRRRGVGVTEHARAAWRTRRRREVVQTQRGRLARCRYCGRLAGNGLVVAFYLLLVLRLGSVTVHHCEQHEDEVTRLTARIVRWVSNLLWGVRFETLRPTGP